MAPVAAAGEIEAVYRQDGDRLWRALYAFAGDEEIASDAATLLRDGRVLVAGGGGISGLYLASAELYDPGSGS